MSDEFRDFLNWILGGLSTLLLGAGGLIFKQIFNKLEELEKSRKSHEEKVATQFDEVSKQFSEMHKDFAELKKELTINALEDKARHDATLAILESLQKGQEKIFDKMEQYDTSISKFYQINPEIKNPEL